MQVDELIIYLTEHITRKKKKFFFSFFIKQKKKNPVHVFYTYDE